MKGSIAVIGASGSMGFKICQALSELLPKQHIVVGDYKLERGEQTVGKLPNASAAYVDSKNASSIEQLVKSEPACVVVAVKQEEPLIQKLCSQNNVSCVDITTFSTFTNKVEQQLPEKTSASIVMAGFFPGMSGIAVKQVIEEFSQVDHVAVNLLQNTQANVGLTGMRDMLRIIAKPLPNEPGFSEKHSVYVANKPYQLRKIHHDEQLILQKKLGIPEVTYHTCWNSEPFNSFMSFIVHCRLIDPLIHAMRLFKIDMDKGTKDETAYLIIEAKGTINNEPAERKLVIEVFSDYGITAWTTALLVKKILENPALTGVCYPFEILAFKEILQLESLGKLKFLERGINVE